jgi:hypothetical protein
LPAGVLLSILHKPMSESNDVWYVRLPDGQVLRVGSTEAVRHHLDTGRIPRDSWVRRSPDDEWVALAWTPELTDPDVPERAKPRPVSPRPERPPAARPTAAPAAPPQRGNRRDDRMRPQTVGARGMLDELLTALDSTLSRIKLRVACATGMVGAVTLLVVGFYDPLLEWPWSLGLWVVAGLWLLLVGAVGTALITQVTFVELSHARPGRWPDAARDLGRNATRLFLAGVVVFGIMALLLWDLSELPSWLPAEWPPAAREAIRGGAMVLLLITLVFVGPVIAFSLMLGPIVVVEECSVGRTFVRWPQFILTHGHRLFLYEALAMVLAIVGTLPFLLPAALAGPFLGLWQSATLAEPWPLVLRITFGILAGFALTPLLAYLAVANVFIYLHLSYEQGSRR